MKKLILAAILFAIGIAFVVSQGCATKVQLTPPTPAVTNADGTVTPGTKGTYTNLPNQTVMKGVEAGKQVAPYIPSPWGKVLDIGLGLLAAGATLIARNQNTQKKDLASVTKTIVTAVETAGDAAIAIKEAIATKALADGTSDSVHAVVQKHTTNQG